MLYVVFCLFFLSIISGVVMKIENVPLRVLCPVADRGGNKALRLSADASGQLKISNHRIETPQLH